MENYSLLVDSFENDEKISKISEEIGLRSV